MSEWVKAGECVPYNLHLRVKRGFSIDYEDHAFECGREAVINLLPGLDRHSFLGRDDWHACKGAGDAIAAFFESVEENSNHKIHEWIERVQLPEGRAPAA